MYSTKLTSHSVTSSWPSVRSGAQNTWIAGNLVSFVSSQVERLAQVLRQEPEPVRRCTDDTGFGSLNTRSPAAFRPPKSPARLR